MYNVLLSNTIGIDVEKCHIERKNNLKTFKNSFLIKFNNFSMWRNFFNIYKYAVMAFSKRILETACFSPRGGGWKLFLSNTHQVIGSNRKRKFTTSGGG